VAVIIGHVGTLVSSFLPIRIELAADDGMITAMHDQR